jgi:hypothetical protein
MSNFTLAPEKWNGSAGSHAHHFPALGSDNLSSILPKGDAISSSMTLALTIVQDLGRHKGERGSTATGKHDLDHHAGERRYTIMA